MGILSGGRRRKIVVDRRFQIGTTVIGLVIKTISMLLKTAVIHSIGRREDQLSLAFQRLYEM